MYLKISLLFGAMLFSVVASSQTWEERTAYPGNGRHHPATFVIDSMAYLLTGSTSSGFTNDFYRYDPQADSWVDLPNFPGAARSFSHGTSANGKGYIGFGVSNNDYLNDLWEFDPVTGDWTELASCPCSKRAHPAFIIEDQKLFVGLGNYSSNFKDWWEYNITTNTWRQLTDLPGPTRHHPYYFAVGGSVYAGLGHGANMNIYKDWYRWDLDTETWEQMNDLPAQGRVAGTQFSIGDRGFILSGDGEDHSTIATGEFWEYDYQTDTWEELPPHPGVSRWAPGSFAIGNTVYFTSGEVHAVNPNAGLKNDLWSFVYEAIASTENSADLNTEITLYPNPSENYVSFKGLNTITPVLLEVYDSSGKIIKKGVLKNGVFDVSDLNSGLYFIALIDDNEVLERVKFIKK